MPIFKYDHMTTFFSYAVTSPTGGHPLSSYVTVPYNEQHVRGGPWAVGIRPLDCNNYENIVSDFYHFWKRTDYQGGGEGRRKEEYGGEMGHSSELNNQYHALKLP